MKFLDKIIKKIMQLPKKLKIPDDLPDTYKSINPKEEYEGLVPYEFPYRSYEFYQGALDVSDGLDNVIKNIEKLVRNSPEYRNYIKFLRDEVKLENCSLLKNINTTNASLELHHYPFTLYDITEIVLNCLIKTKQSFSNLTVAEKVCRAHYENKIGLVPVTKTIHELAHNGEIFINIKHVFGDVSKFMSEYNLGINGSHIEKLEKIVMLSNDKASDRINASILNVNRISLSSDLSNLLLLPNIQEN